MLNKKNQTIVKTVSYILLIIIAIYCVFPFIWMVISAFKPKDEIRNCLWTFYGNCCNGRICIKSLL